MRRLIVAFMMAILVSGTDHCAAAGEIMASAGFSISNVVMILLNAPPTVELSINSQNYIWKQSTAKAGAIGGGFAESPFVAAFPDPATPLSYAYSSDLDSIANASAGGFATAGAACEYAIDYHLHEYNGLTYDHYTGEYDLSISYEYSVLLLAAHFDTLVGDARALVSLTNGPIFDTDVTGADAWYYYSGTVNTVRHYVANDPNWGLFTIGYATQASVLNPVPEPATSLLLGAGFGIVVLLRRKAQDAS